MEFTLPLPAEPNKVENFILNICGTHGFVNCQVVTDGDNLIIRYDEHEISPSIPQTSSESLRTFRC